MTSVVAALVSVLGIVIVRKLSNPVEEILQNVEHLNSGIYETNQSTQQIAQSSNEVADIANLLQKEVDYFVVA